MTSLLELPLTDLLDRLIVDHEHGLASSTVECFFKPGISDFSKFLGRPAVISDLTRDVVNRWLQLKTEAGCALATIKTRRNAILGLWRYAYEAEIIDHEPKRVRKIRLAYAGVTTWTQEEVTQLIRSSFNGPDGYLGDTGLPKSLYFAAIISVAYDTALRLGDLLSLTPAVIGIRNRRGHIRVIESKTGKLKQAILQPYTLRLVQQLIELRPDRELIFPLWCRREQFYRVFRSIVKDAEIRTGTFRWLRRASITHVEIDHPGYGQRMAGHSDAITTQRHYTDPNQIAAELISPPPLFPTSKIG